jgi:hypothetical protein
MGSLSVHPLGFVALAAVFGLAVLWARRRAEALDGDTLRKRGGIMLALGLGIVLAMSAGAFFLEPTPDHTVTSFVTTVLRALMLGTLMVLLAFPAVVLLAFGLVWTAAARDRT